MAQPRRTSGSAAPKVHDIQELVGLILAWTPRHSRLVLQRVSKMFRAEIQRLECLDPPVQDPTTYGRYTIASSPIADPFCRLTQGPFYIFPRPSSTLTARCSRFIFTVLSARGVVDDRPRLVRRPLVHHMDIEAKLVTTSVDAHTVFLSPGAQDDYPLFSAPGDLTIHITTNRSGLDWTLYPLFAVHAGVQQVTFGAMAACLLRWEERRINRTREVQVMHEMGEDRVHQMFPRTRRLPNNMQDPSLGGMLTCDRVFNRCLIAWAVRVGLPVHLDSRGFIASTTLQLMRRTFDTIDIARGVCEAEDAGSLAEIMQVLASRGRLTEDLLADIDMLRQKWEGVFVPTYTLRR